MQQLQIPPLAEGEVYVGAIGDKNGDVEHIILMPGDNEGASQPEQQAWAESGGADLPTLFEQALMHERCPDEFKPAAYWSKRNDGDGWAWYTHFYGGGQYYDGNRKFRARRVRRFKS